MPGHIYRDNLESGKMVSNVKFECSFPVWYPKFKKDSIKATVITIPDDVLKYLEYDAFLLPIEATKSSEVDSCWNDGSPVDEEDSEYQPTFPEFSKQIQAVIDNYDAVFVKTNWSCPSDVTWVAPTKTLKCKTLEEVYLLLKSSDIIAKDLTDVQCWSKDYNNLEPCLVLKQWFDINPCTEFRCFVMENELIAISQREISQYHEYNESEKYDIQIDIKSLFRERIKDRFPLSDYSYDVTRYKKGEVKIIDFGPLNESTTEGTLFTYEELQNQIKEVPEFRFIGEDIGIQPNNIKHFCIPQEINEFFQFRDETLVNAIQKEVEKQRQEQEGTNDIVAENT